MSRRTLNLRRAVVSICVVVTGACGGDPSSRPAEREPTLAPAPVSVDPAPSLSAPVRLPLTFRPAAGEVWVEEVQKDLFSYRSTELPPETPTMRTRRRERFAILSADAETIRVEVTHERLWIEPKDMTPFDSETSQLPQEALVLDRLAFVGIPVVFRLDPTGKTREVEDVEATRLAIDRRWVELRAAAQLPPASADETSQWEHSLNAELTSYAAWGIRPTFPGGPEPISPATRWTETVSTSSLFNAEVTWTIEHTIRDDGGEQLTIDRQGEAVFTETPAMLRMIARADATLVGELVVDPETAMLLHSTTTVSALVELRPQQGLPDGALKMRDTVTRRRLTQAELAEDATRPDPANANANVDAHQDQDPDPATPSG